MSSGMEGLPMSVIKLVSFNTGLSVLLKQNLLG